MESSKLINNSTTMCRNFPYIPAINCKQSTSKITSSQEFQTAKLTTVEESQTPKLIICEISKHPKLTISEEFQMPKVHKFLKIYQHPSSNFLNSKHPSSSQFLKISKHPNSQFLKNSKNQILTISKEFQHPSSQITISEFQTFLQCFFLFFHLIMPKSKSCNKITFKVFFSNSLMEH
jgi:hypothetical protein